MEDRLTMDPESRRNFVYAIVSTQPSPTGRGTKLEWLEYYKLNNEVETYVFLDLQRGVLPEENDVLWFQVDDRIIARARIFRVFFDPMKDLYELWYRGAEVQRIDGVHTEERGSRHASSKAPWIASAHMTLFAGPS